MALAGGGRDQYPKIHAWKRVFPGESQLTTSTGTSASFGKVRSMSRSIRRAQQLSLVRQCLLDVSRASVYSVPTRAEDLALMDRQYLKTPFYGSGR